MSYANLIQERAKALGLPASDPKQIEELMRLETPNLSNISPESFDRELRISIACLESGLMESCEQHYKNFFGIPIGCAVPPGMTPPEF